MANESVSRIDRTIDNSPSISGCLFYLLAIAIGIALSFCL